MEPNAPQAEDLQEAKTEKHVILPALLGLLVLVGGYYWLTSHPESLQTDLVSHETDNNIMLASLPSGFPADIPLEVDKLTEGKTTSYDEPRATQFVVTYVTNKTKEELWTLYSDFVTKSGYKLNMKGTDKNQGVIDATRSKTAELNVLLVPENSSSTVYITYVSIS